mmetsp:Transcript_23197/g.92584  ORF Transcript_23197/g.92584 Transcript_23197/m.92584 type:complete len:81 (+) Transcript_23197:484-726(+)
MACPNPDLNMNIPRIAKMLRTRWKGRWLKMGKRISLLSMSERIQQSVACRVSDHRRSLKMKSDETQSLDIVPAFHMLGQY